MKLIVLTFLVLELTLIQSSPVTKKVEKRTAVESVKADSLSKAVNLKESSLKFENIKPLIPPFLETAKTKDENNKSKIVKRNDLNPVDNSENDSLKREKKSCHISGSNPNKICLEIDCGSPDMVVCQENQQQVQPGPQFIQVTQPAPTLTPQIIQVPQQPPPPPTTQIIQVPQQPLPPPPPPTTQIIQVPQQQPPPPPTTQIIQVPQQPPLPLPPQIIQVPQQPSPMPPQVIQVSQPAPPPPQIIQVPSPVPVQPPPLPYSQCVSLPSSPSSPSQPQVLYLPPSAPQPSQQQILEITSPQIPSNPSSIIYQMSQPSQSIPQPSSSICIESSSSSSSSPSSLPGNSPQVQITSIETPATSGGSFQIRPYSYQTQPIRYTSPQFTNQPPTIQVLPVQTQNGYAQSRPFSWLNTQKIQSGGCSHSLNFQGKPGLQWQQKFPSLIGQCSCNTVSSPAQQLLSSSWGGLIPQGSRLIRVPERSADAVETTATVDNNSSQTKPAITNQPNLTSATSATAT